MRRLILAYYMSIDGKSVGLNDGMRAVMDSIDDPDQEAYYVNELQPGAFLMGRNSYEVMKDFWPTSDHPSAPAMNAADKVVFSRTLTATDDAWPARIASGDTAQEIAKLKAEPGGDLLAAAGDSFLQSLIALDLVDEYRLWVLPAAAGAGTPLFPAMKQPLKLRLVRHTAFPSGILELVYQPVRDAQAS